MQRNLQEMAKGILQGHGVDERGKHAHVVTLGAVHAALAQPVLDDRADPARRARGHPYPAPTPELTVAPNRAAAADTTPDTP